MSSTRPHTLATSRRARLLALVALLLALVTTSLVGGGSLTAASAQPVGVPVPASQTGRVVAWGYSESGETAVPASLAQHHVVAVAAGLQHSLALTAAGHVERWGRYDYGLGQVPGGALRNVTAIAAGVIHALALTADGRVVAWGDNQYGQTSVPASLTGRTVTAIAAGRGFSLALTSDGKLTSWGYDGNTNTSVPASLADKTVVAIAASYSHALAVTSDGLVTAWGSNSKGQSTVPASLADQQVTAVAAGADTSMALTSAGKVVVWGSNDYRQTEVPASLQGKTVTSIAVGWTAIAALTSDGTLTTWGEPMPGQGVITGKPITAIAVGVDHMLAVLRTLHSVSAPELSGAQVGKPLAAHHGHWTDPVGSYAYHWKVAGATVSTHHTFTPTADQYGKHLTLTVTATATDPDQRSASATSEPTVIEKGTFTHLPVPTITGVREMGRALTASLVGVDPNPDSVTFAWMRAGVVLGTGPRYVPGQADHRRQVVVVATVHKLGYHSTAVTSAGSGLIAGCTSYC